MFELEMWRPPRAMRPPRAAGRGGRAARSTGCREADGPAVNGPRSRGTSKLTTRTKPRNRARELARSCVTIKDVTNRPPASGSVGQTVKKKPASGSRPVVSHKRPAAATLGDTTSDLPTRYMGDPMGSQEQVISTASSERTFADEWPATSSETPCTDARFMSPAILQAIDHNVAVHFPSLPRAPSPDFYSMIRDIVAVGDMTLADGLRQAERRQRLTSAAP